MLVDPLVEPANVAELARGRQASVVLTCHWHRRSAAELVEAFGAEVYAPKTSVRDLGIPTRSYAAGDMLPEGIVAQPGGYADECTLWLSHHAALVAGDVLLGGPSGFRLQPQSWLAEGLTHDELRSRLRPLLGLPVALLLPTHGDPVVDDARETLARALAPGP